MTPRVVWSGKQIPLVVTGERDRWGIHLFENCLHLNIINRDFEVAHYRGFTIVTARDNVDDDFSVMAKKTLAADVPAFIRFQSPDEGAESEFLDASYPTREAAVAAVTAFIDASPLANPEA